MALYERLKKAAKLILGSLYRCRMYNLPEKLPEGALVICSNHLSNLDAILLAAYVDRPIVFLAKKQVFNVPIIGYILKKCGAIPLSRDGNDIASVRTAVNVLRSGGLVSIFPQGHRCKRACEETEAKNGAGLLISLGKAKVICVGIYAKNYKVRMFRKTNFVFGEVHDVSCPEAMSGREKNEYITKNVFSEIIELSHKAESLL